MNYSDKLLQFNATQKYHYELQFLTQLVGNPKGDVLDFGCGNGFAVKEFRKNGINAFGHDAVNHNPDFNYADPGAKYQMVYFMHSFAHVKNIREILIDLNCQEIIVITPNRAWLDLHQNKTYAPDPTVINHWYQSDLIELFESLNFNVQIYGQFGELKGDQNERLFIKARRK